MDPRKVPVITCYWSLQNWNRIYGLSKRGKSNALKTPCQCLPIKHNRFCQSLSLPILPNGYFGRRAMPCRWETGSQPQHHQYWGSSSGIDSLHSNSTNEIELSSSFFIWTTICYPAAPTNARPPEYVRKRHPRELQPQAKSEWSPTPQNCCRSKWFIIINKTPDYQTWGSSPVQVKPEPGALSEWPALRRSCVWERDLINFTIRGKTPLNFTKPFHSS